MSRITIWVITLANSCAEGWARLVRTVVFEAVVDLPCALVDEEEPARDQHDVPPREGMPEEFEQRRVRPMIQAIEASSAGG